MGILKPYNSTLYSKNMVTRRHKFLAPPQIYNTVLQVCLPLVLSLSATTVMEFTDRIFLANYSINAISAALPAGVTSYIFLAFFGGIGGYVGVFIAQYTGRKDKNKIGRILLSASSFQSRYLFWRDIQKKYKKWRDSTFPSSVMDPFFT